MGESNCLEATKAFGFGLFGLLGLLPLGSLWQPGRPVEDLQPEAMPLQGIAELLSSLQRPAGLIRVGKTSSDAVLLRLGTKRICRSRRVVARRQIRPTATSRPTSCPFSFRGTFWRLSQGSEGGQDSPNHLPNRGRSGPICLIGCLIAGAGQGQFFRPCLT